MRELSCFLGNWTPRREASALKRALSSQSRAFRFVLMASHARIYTEKTMSFQMTANHPPTSTEITSTAFVGKKAAEKPLSASGEAALKLAELGIHVFPVDAIVSRNGRLESSQDDLAADQGCAEWRGVRPFREPWEDPARSVAESAVAVP